MATSFDRKLKFLDPQDSAALHKSCTNGLIKLVTSYPVAINKLPRYSPAQLLTRCCEALLDSCKYLAGDSIISLRANLRSMLLRPKRERFDTLQISALNNRGIAAFLRTFNMALLLVANMSSVRIAITAMPAREVSC